MPSRDECDMPKRPVPSLCPACKKRKVRPYYWSFDGVNGKCVVWQCQRCGALLELAMSNEYVTNMMKVVGMDVNTIPDKFGYEK